jgi:tight adherence protein C
MVFGALAVQPVLAALGLGGAIALVIFAMATQADERAKVRSSLRQLEGYDVIEDVRDKELLIPLRDRAIMPALDGLTAIGRRLTPVGYVDKVRMKFTYAGDPSADAVDRFLAIRVATVVVGVIGAFFILGTKPIDGQLNFALGVLWGLVFLVGPDASLNRRVAERQQELQRKLPDILDLLTISVEAGLGFEQALDRTVDAVPGPLSDEFARMLGEVRAGATRADAMHALEARTSVPEIRSFVLAILQADTFGVSIGRVLRSQAEEMRIKRRQLAQEKAQKAPVKMLIPMVFCIFPALFVVVLAPAVLNIVDNI